MKNRFHKQARFHNRDVTRLILALVACLLLTQIVNPFGANAQELKRIDKVKSFLRDDVHSAKKATIYSAILPGWGQAYNRKYWKIPIVYAGFGAVGYFVKTNHDLYTLRKEEYKILDDDPNATTISGKPKAQIRVDIDTYRRTRDLSIIGLALWYGLNLIDANVDGHFYNFDVDDDLTLKIQPKLLDASGLSHGVGLSLNLTWR